MPVPKRQHSKSRTNKRAAGKHKIQSVAGKCSVCQAIIEQHAICLGCGFYKGMKVIRTKSERSEERKISTQIKERSLQALTAKKNIAAAEAAKKAASEE